MPEVAKWTVTLHAGGIESSSGPLSPLIAYHLLVKWLEDHPEVREWKLDVKYRGWPNEPY